MRRRTLSTILLSSGAALGVVTTLAWMIGFDPTPQSPAIITVALYKLTYIAAGGMLAAGALLGRWARRDQPSVEDTRPIGDPVSGTRQLNEGVGIDEGRRDDRSPEAHVPLTERRRE